MLSALPNLVASSGASLARAARRSLGALEDGWLLLTLPESGKNADLTARAWLSSTERSTLLTLGALVLAIGLMGLWRRPRHEEGAGSA